MSADTMMAVRAHEYGGPEVLVLEEVPRPRPGPAQVQVQIHAAGVNPADWKYRSGISKQYMPLQFPWTPGLEGAGVVAEAGPGVDQFPHGQAVYGLIASSYAEYAVAPAGDLRPEPTNLTFDEAASVPMGALTAWGAVVETARVQPGQRVLVHGAAGGVGVFAVQLARWKGARVIGTTSTRNVDFVRTMGVQEVIDYTAGPFEQSVRDVDVVIDAVGGELPERSLRILRPGGTLVTVAAMLPPDFGKDRDIRATTAGRAPTETLAEISRLLEAGTLRPAAGRIFPLAEARQAHELSQTGHGAGRIVLHIAD